MTGPRLLLRPLAESDHAALFAAASDPLVWEQHPDRRRHTPEGFAAYFRSGIESKGALAVIDRASGELAGSSRYRDHRPRESSVEIGYTFLARRYWGGSYNRELKALMLEHAFKSVDAVRFIVGEHNHRSRRALAKLGAVEDAGACSGDERCSVVYRITKAAWRARA